MSGSQIKGIVYGNTSSVTEKVNFLKILDAHAKNKQVAVSLVPVAAAGGCNSSAMYVPKVLLER